MKFFFIESDSRTVQPHFLDWSDEITSKRLAAWDFPKLGSFDIELIDDVEFPDIVSFPCLMISKGFAQLVSLYDESIQFKYVILNDSKSQRHITYSIPRVKIVDCLSQESELDFDGNALKRTVLLRDAVQGRTLFQIGGVKKQYVVASLELVESAFRREIRGLRVIEVEMSK